MGLRIQQSCPQCGAQLELEETDRLIKCPYCKVSSIILSSGYFRYVMHHNAPGKEIIYAPYLRFKGAIYYCQGLKVNSRMVDISSPATFLKPLYNSLGVRPQTVKAGFVKPETEGLFLPITADLDDIVARAAVLTDKRIPGKGIPVKTCDEKKTPALENESKDNSSRGLGSAIASFIKKSHITEYLGLTFFPEFSLYDPETCFTVSESKTEPEKEEILYYEFIGETISIVYLPLYLENDMLYDAIINESLGNIDDENAAVLESAASNSGWRVDFLPILCPQCGWELGGNRNSIAFTCGNCFTAWEVIGGKLDKTTLLTVPGEDDTAGYLPFWKITATCPELGIQSYADLVHLANPLISTEEYADRKASFFIPAFKVAPKVFLTTAQRITFTQDALPPEETQVEVNSICAVTMPREEAIQSIKLVLASGAYAKKKIASKLPAAQVEVIDSALVYLPFNDRGYELSSQYGVRLAIIKQALEMTNGEPQFEKEAEPEVISVICPLCGKKVPGGLRNCPYCGAGL